MHLLSSGAGQSDDVENVGRNWDKSAVVCDPWAYGLNISFDWPFSYARIPFGDSFAAYSAALLEQNMKAMHSTFSGVRLRMTAKSQTVPASCIDSPAEIFRAEAYAFRVSLQEGFIRLLMSSQMLSFA